MNGGMEHLGEGEAWDQGPDVGLCGVPRMPQEQWVHGRRAAQCSALPLAHKQQRESIQGTEDEAVGEEVSSKASP